MTEVKCSGVEAKVVGEATQGGYFLKNVRKNGFEHKGGGQIQTLLRYVGKMLLRPLDELTNMFQVCRTTWRSK